MLVYIGKGCVCMRTLCDFTFVDNITVDTSSCSNICACKFTKFMEYNFNYSSPVMSYQLLQSNYTLNQDLLPIPMGMNLTLVKKSLQHYDLCQLLEHIWNGGQKTLIIVHRDTEEITMYWKKWGRVENIAEKLLLDCHWQQWEFLISCFTQLWFY